MLYQDKIPWGEVQWILQVQGEDARYNSNFKEDLVFFFF